MRVPDSAPEIVANDVATPVGGSLKDKGNAGAISSSRPPSSPVWSPDDTALVYIRGDTIYRRALAGGNTQEIALFSDQRLVSVNDWSGDSKFLLLTMWDTKKPEISGRGIWLLPDPMDDSKKREPVFLETVGLHPQSAPAVGPPRWFSYDGFGQLFIQTMPGSPPGKWQVSEGALNSRWRRDGTELFFSNGISVMSMKVDPTASFHPGPIHKLFPVPDAFRTAFAQYALGYDVMPDGQKFLVTSPTPDTSTQAIDVVVNWQSAPAK